LNLESNKRILLKELTNNVLNYESLIRGSNRYARCPVGKIAEKQSLGVYFWQYDTIFWVPN